MLGRWCCVSSHVRSKPPQPSKVPLKLATSAQSGPTLLNLESFACRGFSHICATRNSNGVTSGRMDSQNTEKNSKDFPSSDTELRKFDPASDFGRLADVFSRRLVVGTATASFVALGGNLGGITSFLLGFEPEVCRNLKLDVVYPINGYKRCVDTNNRFEFIYPYSWVGDKRLLYKAVERAERERALDLPSLEDRVRRPETVTEPIVAFGPPGSNGELNVSVIVAPVPNNFAVEIFGTPKEAGEAILSKLIVPRGSNITAMLLEAKKREDGLLNQKVGYYSLEYTVWSPSFFRHNIAVYTAFDGQLYTLNA